MVRHASRLFSAFVFALFLTVTTTPAFAQTLGVACTSPSVGITSTGTPTYCNSSVYAAPAIVIGTSNASCASGNAGQVQWTGSALQNCNGTSWNPLGANIYNAGSSTSLDWSQGTTQYTTASCGALTFTNMLDGNTYQLFVEGTTAGTCSFSQSGLTFKLPSNFGATTAGTMTIFSFTRAGSNVFVAWIPGY